MRVTPRFKTRKGSYRSAERFEDLSRVVVRLHLTEDLLHGPVLVDDDSRPLDAHVRLAGEGLLRPEAVLLGELVVRIGKQGEREPVLVLELGMRRLAVRADAVDLRAGLAERVPGVADPARLLGTARGVVPGIEVEDDLTAAKVRESATVSPVSLFSSKAGAGCPSPIGSLIVERAGR